MLEDLEAARVRDIEELEVRVELRQAIEDWSPAKSPAMMGHESSAGNRRSASMVLDRLSFIKNDTIELHSVQYSSLLLVSLLPPADLLFGSLAIDWGLILRIRLHYLCVCRKNNVVLR